MIDDQITLKVNQSNTDSQKSVAEIQDIAGAKIVGTITKKIGRGDDAKNSIIWMTITWCLIIATSITAILLLFLYFAYCDKNMTEIAELKRFISTIWAIFSPIITLSLGYAFGRDFK